MYIECHRGFYIYNRGPAAMLLLSLGVVSRERFSCLELVKEYIRHKQLFEVKHSLLLHLLVRSKEKSEDRSVIICEVKFFFPAIGNAFVDQCVKFLERGAHLVMLNIEDDVADILRASELGRTKWCGWLLRCLTALSLRVSVGGHTETSVFIYCADRSD